MKKAYRQVVILLIGCFWWGALIAQEHQQVYTVSAAGVEEPYELVLVYDSAQFPAYFFRDIFTPVCLDSVCKPVRIKLFWDLLGNYLRYEVPPDEPLTKLNHEEFAPEDHERLQEILSNEQSLLKDFKMEELVDRNTQKLSDSVDAVTGATKNTVKSEVIEGALYTCYTLWHLAHGTVVNEIQKLTREKLDNNMLHHFLGDTNFHYVYFALNEVMDTAGIIHPDFLPDVLSVLAGDNVFAARYVWQRIDLRYFAEREQQERLWDIFERTPYTQQLALLKRMSALVLDPHVLNDMASGLSKLNPTLFKQVLHVIAAQDSLPSFTQEKLLTYLTSADQEKSRLVYETLKNHSNLGEPLKKQLSLYKKP